MNDNEAQGPARTLTGGIEYLPSTSPGDELERLGDRIAALTPQEAKQLNRYLSYFYQMRINLQLY